MKTLAFAAGLVVGSLLVHSSPGVAAPKSMYRFFDQNTKAWVVYTPPAAPIEARAAANPVPREIVAYDGPHDGNTIVVDTSERRLYFVIGDGTAVKYGVGVGREGFEWTGTNRISRKAEWPGWTPPPAMRKRRPELPAYMEGGPSNPLGARAMYLGSTLYRIHGSNEPQTIGQAVSSGCIRMANDDVTHLYDLAQVGTKVIVQN